MRKYREVDEWRRNKARILEATLCDICGVADDKASWGAIFTLELDMTHSDGYDQYGDKKSLDICDRCIKSKVVPKLIEIGAPVRLGDADEDGLPRWFYFDNRETTDAAQ